MPRVICHLATKNARESSLRNNEYTSLHVNLTNAAPRSCSTGEAVLRSKVTVTATVVRKTQIIQNGLYL